MNCRQARERFADLLGDDWEGFERNEVESHLHSCPGCRAEFEELRQVWQDFGDLASFAEPEGLQDRLEALTAYFSQRPSRRFAAPRRRQALLQALAALLLLAVGVVIGYRLQPAGNVPEARRTLSRYLLLLHEKESRELTDTQQRQLVGEYSVWYRSLVARGFGLQGERLHKERRLLVGRDGEAPRLESEVPSDSAGLVSGYFLVQADSLSEALEIASGCPHLKVGSIEVRELYP